MPKMPLEGIRVADFGWRVVAPVSARMLAWGGAEVIRVESSTRHDGARLSPPSGFYPIHSVRNRAIDCTGQAI